MWIWDVECSLMAELQRRIPAMELSCYRKILHMSYKDHVTNEELVLAKIQQAIGPHEDLLTTVKRHKLQWYGHVSRSSGLAKTISQGTVKGERRQGRQRKRWEDNIREWTGLEFAKSQRAVENREKWRKLVSKSLVVPQQPLRLSDRWDDDEFLCHGSKKNLSRLVWRLGITEVIWLCAQVNSSSWWDLSAFSCPQLRPVSYTHLTLPTTILV